MKTREAPPVRDRLAGHPAHGRRQQRPHHRFALLGYAVTFAAALALFGVDLSLGVLATVLNVAFLAYFFRHLAFAVAAARWAERDIGAASVGVEAYTPSVAVLVVCGNDGSVVDRMVTALLRLDYPADDLTLVVVDDAATDGTGDRLRGWAAEEPRLRVLHRAPDAGGGRSGALDAALVGIRSDITVVVDADHEADRQALRRLVRHFRDPQVAAVTGRGVVGDGGRPSLAATIFVDYLAGCLVHEYGRQALFELPASGGAVRAVRTEALRASGAWEPAAGTGDTDLSLRLLLGGRRVRYDPAAVGFAQAAVSSRRCWRQRYQSARDHQRSLREHWWAVVRSPRLSVPERVETLMFLAMHHVPVLCGLGVLLTGLRFLGIGGPAWLGLLPLAALLFAGPFVELAVGLLVGRVQRRAAWLLVGFVPALITTIVTATAAYLDGMWGRSTSGPVGSTASPHPSEPAPTGTDRGPISFARRQEAST